jgi:hypothetical protein
MVKEMHWGALTSTQVIEIAKLQKLDESGDFDMTLRNDLARIDDTKNASRDISRRVPKTRFPRLKYHPIPIHHKRLGHGRPSLPFQYPHEMFAALFTSYPLLWATVIAPPGEVERFWHDVSRGIG